MVPAEPFPHKCVPTIGHRDLLDVLFGIKEGCGFSFTQTRRGTRQAQVNGRAQPSHPMSYNETVAPAEPFRLLKKRKICFIFKMVSASR